MSIGENLKKARIQAGLTQEQVAAAAGMNVTQYNGYERERSRPSELTLARLAEALQTRLDVLAAYESEPATPKPAATEGSIALMRDAFRAQVAEALRLPIEGVTICIELR